MSNMSIPVDTRNLLEYNAKHKLLVCRECKYAIQKSAVGSHLLRHKIYRGERQRLLSSISQFELLEPDDVHLPPARSPPVDVLPVISGYRCTATGCESLYASSKRVRRHWSETHGVSDPSDSCARPVKLQTFFRGTKLRYFEVTSPVDRAGRPPATSDGAVMQQHEPIRQAIPSPNSQTFVLPPDPSYDLDLDTLRYFHHFTTKTSLTLPSGDHDPVNRWQKDVVEQALGVHWLMYGLLGISASHLGVLSDDETSKQLHVKRSVRFLKEFYAGWADAKHASTSAESEEAKTAAQTICILHCFQWTAEPLAFYQEMLPQLVPFQLQSFIMTIASCANRDFALHYAASSGDSSEEVFLRTRTDSEGSSDAGDPNRVPPALLERLRLLPFRMAEALEKPDSIDDFTATVPAIDALVECFCLSYASDDMAAVWMGMESWLRRVPEHFMQMLWCRSSAALIVLAHWSLLVERAERHCWFLKGLGKKLRQQIVEEFPRDDKIQSLVEYSMG